MSYDQNKTRDLLKISGAFNGQPSGEYIQAIAEQLRFAEAELSAMREKLGQSESSVGRLSTDLETAQQNVKRLRDGNSGMADVVKVLESISINPKGSQKIAKDALAKLSGGAK